MRTTFVFGALLALASTAFAAPMPAPAPAPAPVAVPEGRCHLLPDGSYLYVFPLVFQLSGEADCTSSC
jgi:hypothetical protein